MNEEEYGLCKWKEVRREIKGEGWERKRQNVKQLYRN